MEMNVQSLTLDELKVLGTAVQNEIAARTSASIPRVLWTHQCQNGSKHHLGKYKHWAKLITGVDATKTNGYAWQGDFLSVAAEHMVPVGSCVAEVCDTDITVYHMIADGAAQIGSASTRSQHALIATIAEKLQGGY